VVTENTEPAPAPEDAERPRDERIIERDYMLQALARSVAKGHMTLSLTVVAGGATMSGLLVPRLRWYEMQAERSPDGAGKQFLQGFADIEREDPAEVPEDLERFGFLHLADARLIEAGASSGGGLFFRVRISEVAAWSFAALEAR